jgi:hypothetical protein
LANTTVLIVAAMVVVLACGVGIGWGFVTTVSPTSGTVTTITTTAQGQGPVSVTLVVTTGNIFNKSVGEQPAFYVLTGGVLRSSTHIAFPSNTLIKLTIINYDTGNASLIDPQYSNVQGTVNGTITYFSNANINSSQGTAGIDVKGGNTVSSVPPSQIAHTFTIPSLKLNIPIPLSSTVVAYFKIDKAGTYLWYCETACGSGPAGTLGAMETPGWMTGDADVS